MGYQQTAGVTAGMAAGGEYGDLAQTSAEQTVNTVNSDASTSTSGYQQSPGMTGSISAGGEYDNIDTVTAVQYANIAAEDANDAAASAIAAAASATAAASSASSASTSATSAGTSASNASTSATNAATSASNASTSATTATTQATAASTSATASATSASAASTSATNAATSASGASTSASNAATSASSAATSATNASNSATSASTSASTATTKASEASTSATNASNSATSASGSATTAATQAGIATTQASNASTSASSASASASSASASASTATTQASNASASATSASGSATAAGTSATNAASSASSASTNATSASNSATSANTSAINSATSETNAAASASSASTSATTATTQAGIATTQASSATASASTATTQAGIATTQASNAASSASSASTSASNANTSALAAAASYDSFDDRYLGAKTSDPTVDNDGNALLTGALYFNTVDAVMKVYTGTVWLVAYVSAAGVLLAANNLSDLSSISTARTNLGLGTAATTNSIAYATAAQGATADTAIQAITSTDGSVAVTTSGTLRDLSVAVSGSTTNVICLVRNTTGATLTKGTAVYINGAVGQNPTVAKALATSDATSAQTLGLMTADLANNSNGYVTIIGLITNIDTSAYTDGEQLYLSPTTAGTLTGTKPHAPQHLVYAAVVEHAHPTQGKLFVKVQNGYEMDELHNVSAQNPTNGQVLIYNETTSLWEKHTLTAGSGITVTNGAGSISVAVDSTSKSNWDTAYTDRLKWDGGSTGLDATTGRTSLGVTATGSDTTYNYRANNLSDVASVSTARSNLSAAKSGANTDITSVALTTGAVSTSPSADTDIANKLYVDSIASGINFHAACDYATTADLGTVSYNNGTSGVGATITKTTTFATLSIDGASPTVGQRILVKNQTDTSQNGVYTVTNVGSGSTAWVLTRATDYDTSGTGTNEVDAGDFILVLSGTINTNTSWVQQTLLPITVGTTGIVFTQFAAPSTFTYPGAGIVNSTGSSWGTSYSTTGSGNVVLATSPTLVTPALGTPASGILTNCTFPTLNQNTTGSSGSCTGNAATVTNGFYTTSSFNLGTTSIAVNRASAAQSLTGINIDGSSGSCTGNAATATTATTATTANALNTANSYTVVNLTATGTVSGSSDERKKTNWQNLPTDFVEQLSQVKHGVYDRIDNGATQVGVSAQSLRLVLEHAVLEDDNGDLSVAYGNAALVACVQLAQRVLSLEEEIKKLKESR